MDYATLLIMKIGVFDSGIGGKTIADALELAFLDDEIVYVNDRAHMPYGIKTPEEIKQLTLVAIHPLVVSGCKVIVIACNTASTNALEFLRTSYPKVFFVGLDPMIKPAAELTHTKVIGVCATSATLASPTYLRLKKAWCLGMQVVEPDCDSWATYIENEQADKVDVEAAVHSLIHLKCDVIVLACTHYHLLKPRFEVAAPNIIILEPTDAIGRRIAHFKQDYKLFTATIN